MWPPAARLSGCCDPPRFDGSDGVRHCSVKAITPRLTSLFPAALRVSVPADPAIGVGHAVCSLSEDEEPLPSVARPGLARAENSDRNAAAQSFQCRDGNGELSVGVPRDVLAEETSSPALIEHVDRAVEKPAVIVGAQPLSGDAVTLARVARQDAIHCAAPCSSVKGSQIRPDRSRMKPPRFHARDKACDCTDFPLHESDAARVGSGNADAKVEAADSGTKGEGM